MSPSSSAPPRRRAFALHPEAERRYRERTPRSLELLQQTKPLIPTGHGGGMWYQLPYPVLLERGKGSRVWDVDGNGYLDLRIGDWVMILGHCDDASARRSSPARQGGAVRLRRSGTSRYRMASLLVERMPVGRARALPRLGHRGQPARPAARARVHRPHEARQGAGQLPRHRGRAGRRQLADQLRADGSRPGVSPGVAQDVVEFPFNDPDGAEEVLEREADELAAVLVEPVHGRRRDDPRDRREFLQRLRDVTARLGIVLIFDEVVTFPIAYGGAQAHHGVTPDLTTMSKAIGGGLPHGGGRRPRRDHGPARSRAPRRRRPGARCSTFGGNQAALAAGIAALEQLTPEVHARVQAIGDRARDGIDELGAPYGIPLHATGLGHLFGDALGARAGRRLPDADAGRQREDRQHHAGLLNEGFYQFSFGTLLLSAEHGDAEIDEFLAALERALHAVDLIP